MHRFHHWRVQIQDAHDTSALARVLRDYRLTLSPAMVESLPSECRAVLDSSDIPGAALALLHAEVTEKSTPDVAALLHEIAQTYAAAAVKMVEWRPPRCREGTK